ncbi:hypothetical protein QZH41_018859 [Actinostola sp. cb2023]|nr:hypothetical protein QZH41_018859 [Actinostola sp. cb2023]
MLSFCCHPNSSVEFGKLLRSVRHGEETFSENNFDITFPLFGYEGFRNSYRNHAFLSLVRAPRVILLVHDGRSHTRTSIVVTTIVSAWPMLLFILVTASLSGIIIWFLIGAVNGSEEYRLGVSMNADMKVYSNVMKITKDLLKNDIDGALVDNYVITHFLKFIRDEPIRVEQYIDHPISYGVVLAKNSTRLEMCMREYAADYPHEIFESIAHNLTPLKNPTDDVSQQLKAAEALFYQERTFTWIMYAGLGSVATLFLAGIIWEYAYRRPNLRNQRIRFGPKMKFSSSDETAKLQIIDNSQMGKLDDMISEYQVFHDSWIENLKRLRDSSNGNQLSAINSETAEC